MLQEECRTTGANTDVGTTYQSVPLRIEVAADNIVGVTFQGAQAVPVSGIPQLQRSVIGGRTEISLSLLPSHV